MNVRSACQQVLSNLSTVYYYSKSTKREDENCLLLVDLKYAPLTHVGFLVLSMESLGNGGNFKQWSSWELFILLVPDS